MTTWAARPWEERSLLNPAFVGLLVHGISKGYIDEHGEGLPFLLAFLSVPIVLHAPTRESLPRSVATSVPAFHTDHPDARVNLGPVAVQFAPSVREAIRYAARHRVIDFGPRATLVAGKLGQAPRNFKTDDVVECRERARFVGRWFGRAGDPVTVLTSWGLKP